MTTYTKYGARRGVTLIEAVLFISIALGLIVGGLVFFQQASLAARTNDAVRSISSFASEIRAAYRTQDSFSGLTAAVLVNSGAVPPGMLNADGSGILNEWNQPVIVRGNLLGINGVYSGTTGGGVIGDATQAQYFEIEYTNIPVAACTRLATSNTGSGPIGPGIVAVRVRNSSATAVITPAGTVSNVNGPTNVSLNGQVSISPAAAAAACNVGDAPMDLIFTLAR